MVHFWRNKQGVGSSEDSLHHRSFTSFSTTVHSKDFAHIALKCNSFVAWLVNFFIGSLKSDLTDVDYYLVLRMNNLI